MTETIFTTFSIRDPKSWVHFNSYVRIFRNPVSRFSLNKTLNIWCNPSSASYGCKNNRHFLSHNHFRGIPHHHKHSIFHLCVTEIIYFSAEILMNASELTKLTQRVAVGPLSGTCVNCWIYWFDDSTARRDCIKNRHPWFSMNDFTLRIFIIFTLFSMKIEYLWKYAMNKYSSVSVNSLLFLSHSHSFIW